MDRNAKAQSKTLLKLGAGALISFIVVSWVVALALVKQTNLLALPLGDIATITFGASSFFLFIYSFVLGILGFMGYQQIWRSLEARLAGAVEEAVDRAAEVKIKDLQNEMQVRTFNTIGYLTAEMSLRYGGDSIEVVDKERLSEALGAFEEAYESFSKSKDELLADSALKAKYNVLNNLLFYSSIGGNANRPVEFLLEKAEDLMRVGKAHKAPNLMLTASGIFVCHGATESKRSEVIAILKELKEHPRLSIRKRNEANHYLKLASPRTETQSERPGT
jgi:hypothetical protein